MKCVDIKNPGNCCGCSACADACPTSSIDMVSDAEGFIYPKVKIEECISCGKCKSACPILGANQAKNIVKDNIAYAYVSKSNETVRTSSSGGAFSMIMDGIASRYSDFVIIGAAFDGTEVKHLSATDRASAEIFKKSKYIQSNTNGIYKLAKEKLTQKSMVMFSGTPCQIAALKCYLGRDYENLLTVDIVCHGVPSQIVFSEYITEMEQKNGSKVIAVEFRHKRDFDGVKTNPRTINLYFDNGKCMNMDMSQSEFLYAYYTGLIYRPSCAICKFACPSRTGDITLGDYWGIEKIQPSLNSLRGVSLVRFNTQKGNFLIEQFKKNGLFIETEWDFACAENHQLSFPSNPHRNHDKFMRLRKKGTPFIQAVNICKKPDNFFQKVYHKLLDTKAKIVKS